MDLWLDNMNLWALNGAHIKEDGEPEGSCYGVFASEEAALAELLVTIDGELWWVRQCLEREGVGCDDDELEPEWFISELRGAGLLDEVIERAAELGWSINKIDGQSSGALVEVLAARFTQRLLDLVDARGGPVEQGKHGRVIPDYKELQGHEKTLWHAILMVQQAAEI